MDGGVEVGASGRQVAQGVAVVGEDAVGERGAPLIVACLDVGAEFDEQARQVDMQVPDEKIQGSEARVVARFKIRAMFEQNVDGARFAGEVQERAVGVRAGVRGSSRSEKSLGQGAIGRIDGGFELRVEGDLDMVRRVGSHDQEDARSQDSKELWILRRSGVASAR